MSVTQPKVRATHPPPKHRRWAENETLRSPPPLPTVLEPGPDSIAHRLPLPAGHQVKMEDDLVTTVEIASDFSSSLSWQ